MATGLRRVDGSCLLFVEPRLIGDLDVVSVRVDDVCRGDGRRAVIRAEGLPFLLLK